MIAELFGSDLLPIVTTADENSQLQSYSDAGESCGPLADSQAPGPPALSWSAPDPNLVQKRGTSGFCPASQIPTHKKDRRPEDLIEPNIPLGEPDDSRNYGDPNVRLPVPEANDDKTRRCASQKRTLCCKGPANMPRIVQNCWHCMFLFSKE